MFATSAAAVEIVVDDTSSQFARFGTAAYWSQASIGYGGHIYYTRNNQTTQDNYGRWSPNLSSGGNYEVFAYIPNNYATTQSARYKIRDGYGAVTTRTINQLNYSNVWVSLGTYYFSSGTSGYVELGDVTGETSLSRYIGFDAVKWVSMPFAAPSLSSPSNGSSGISRTTRLNWSDIISAESYRVQVDTSSSFPADASDPRWSTIPVNMLISGVPPSSYYDISSPLNYETTYYWRVRAGSAVAGGNWSSTYSFTTEQAPKPNITYYTPSGWSSPIVVTNSSGSTSQGSVSACQPTYINWSIANLGAGNANTRFYTNLYIDDFYITQWYTDSLTAGYSTNARDWQRSFTPGSHTIRIVTDANGNISESNEGDNSYQQTFFWNDCSPNASISSPSNGSTFAVPYVTVSGTCTDDGGNLSYASVVNTTTGWSETQGGFSGTSRNFSISNVPLNVGENRIRATCYDNNGNNSSSPLLTVFYEEPYVEAAEFGGDITVPDGTYFDPGTTFIKTWRIYNRGTDIWDSSFKLRYVNGVLSTQHTDVPVSGTVAPNSYFDFSVPMRAPDSGTNVTESWRLVNTLGSAVSGGTVTAVINVRSDAASLVSQSFPDGYQLQPYQTFTKYWRIQNTGELAWNQNYYFRHVSGNLSVNTDNIFLNSDVAPGGSYDLYIPMVAPATGGATDDRWELVNSRGTTVLVSGQTMLTTLATVTTSSAVAWVSETIPDGTSYAPNSVFDKTWTLRNSGTTTWTTDFYLRRRDSAILSTTTSIPVTRNIAPGETFTFSVRMQAPTTSNTYQEKWEFVDANNQTLAIRGSTWSSATIWARIVVTEPDSPPDHFPVPDTANPSTQKVNEAVHQLASQHLIPPVILQTLAYKEGASNAKWKQYWPEAGSQYYSNCNADFPYGSGDVIYGYDFTNCQVTSVGIGLMQITLPVTGDVSNRDAIQFSDPALAQTLRTDWQTNLAKGVEKLNIKWNKNITGMSGCDADKTILENWYYPIAWYNGSGDAAYNYTSVVYDYIEGTRAIQSDISAWITTISDISSPRIIPGFSTTITTNPSSSNNGVFLLSEIVQNGGRIHRWVGLDQYIDITDSIENGTCEPFGSTAGTKPTQVQGVKLASVGTQITVTWSANAIDDSQPEYFVTHTNTATSATSRVSAGTSTSWISTLATGTYRFTVEACNSFGCGPTSTAKQQTIVAEATVNNIPKVTGLRGAANGNLVRLDWDTSSATNLVGYDLKWENLDNTTDKGGVNTPAGITYYESSQSKNGRIRYQVAACAVMDASRQPVSTACGPYSDPLEIPITSAQCVAIQNGQKYQTLINQTATKDQFTKYCPINIPSGTKLFTVQLGGVGIGVDPNDLDLYLRYNEAITSRVSSKKNELDYQVPYLDGSFESVTMEGPTAGTWYIAVDGTDEMTKNTLNYFLTVRVVSNTEYLSDFLNRNGASKIPFPANTDRNWYWFNGLGTHLGTDAEARDLNYKDPGRGPAEGGWDDYQEPVYSVFDGVVLFSGLNGILNCPKNSDGSLKKGCGFGNTVLIQSDYDSDFVVRYAHLDQINNNIKQGMHIQAGTHLGALGTTGASTGPHLHFALYKDINLNKSRVGNNNKTASSSGFQSVITTGYLNTLSTGAATAMLPKPEEGSVFVESDYFRPLKWQPQSTNTAYAYYLQLACPANFDIVDDQGLRIGKGPQESLVNEIPGAEFYTLSQSGEEQQFISLPEGIDPTRLKVRIQGTGAGAFNLLAIKQNSETIESLTYLGEPIDENTSAEILLANFGAESLAVRSVDDILYQPDPSSFTQVTKDTTPIIDSISLNTLDDGSEITLQGQNFGLPGEYRTGEIELINGNKLYRPFSVISWSDTAVVATLSSPLPSGEYGLRLWKYSSQSSSNTMQIHKLEANQAPVIYSIDRYYIINDEEDSLHIYGNSFHPNATVSIGQDAATKNVISADHIILTIPTGLIGIKDLTVTNLNGQQSTLTGAIEFIPPDGDLDGDTLTNRNEVEQGLNWNSTDTDEDGVTDNIDLFPLDSLEWSDNNHDGIGDNTDGDDDSDGVLDLDDACPLDPNDDEGDPCNHNDCADLSMRDEIGDACIHNDCADLSLQDAVGDACIHNDCADFSLSDAIGDACIHNDCADLTLQDNIGEVCNHDEDSDGVTDTEDACPLLANDGIGDSCNPDDCADLSAKDSVGNTCVHNDCADESLEDNIGNACVHNDCEDESIEDAIGEACNHDEDSDGVTDTEDACPLLANDGVGDPCNPNDCANFSAKDTVGNACVHNDCADESLEDNIGNACVHNDCADESIEDAIGEACNHTDCPDFSEQDFWGDACNHNDCPDGSAQDNVGNACVHNDCEDGSLRDNTGEACIHNDCVDGSAEDAIGNACAHNDCADESMEDATGDACNHNDCSDGSLQDNDADPCNHNDCSDGTAYDTVSLPCNHDEDDDGVADEADACPFVANDPIGNPCDPNDCPDESPQDTVGTACNHNDCTDGSLRDNEGDACNHSDCADGSLQDDAGDACNHQDCSDGSLQDDVGDACNHSDCPDGSAQDTVGDACNHNDCADGSLRDNIGDACNHEDTDPSDRECREGKIKVCHKPEEAAEQELCISPSARGGHLRHGDTEGNCEREDNDNDDDDGNHGDDSDDNNDTDDDDGDDDGEEIREEKKENSEDDAKIEEETKKDDEEQEQEVKIEDEGEDKNEDDEEEETVPSAPSTSSNEMKPPQGRSPQGCQQNITGSGSPISAGILLLTTLFLWIRRMSSPRRRGSGFPPPL